MLITKRRRASLPDSVVTLWNSLVASLQSIFIFVTWETVKNSLIFVGGIAAGQVTRLVLTKFGIGATGMLSRWRRKRALTKLDKAKLVGPGFRVIEYGPSIIVEDDALVDSGESFHIAPPNEEVAEIARITGGQLSFSLPQAFGRHPEEFFATHASGRYIEYYREALRIETRRVCDQTTSMLFNGPLYGIRSLRSGIRAGNDERPKLFARFYRTDYFTFLVVQKMIDLMSDADKERLLSLNSNSSVIAEEFFPFIPSVGLNAFVFSEDERKVFLVIRSKNAARFEGQRDIYPSVNEALSQTDVVNTVKNGECPSLRRCLSRGFEEELGITESYLEDIQFSHVAYGTVGVGLGIFATCKTTKTFQEIRDLMPAKDRAIEVTDFIEVDFNKKGILKIINDGRCSRHVAASLLMIAAARGISVT
ncbi:MAG: hypothetical protein KF887_17005 [Paracoccaceae bacterium]|nr:MAG: hypothetical protein KF887_17005 [Paracoccaceae bacterium]